MTQCVVYYGVFVLLAVPELLLPIICPSDSPVISREVQATVATGNPWLSSTSSDLTEPFTVAFIGDMNVGVATGSLFQRIAPSLDLLILLGDLDYFPNPDAWIAQLDAFFPIDFPILVSAGNHDIGVWGAYQSILKKRWRLSGLDQVCEGVIGIQFHCHLGGIHWVQGAPANTPLNFTDYLVEVVSEAVNAPTYWTDPLGEWKVCIWHLNHVLYQLTNQDDPVPLEVYDLCRGQGALTVAGHDHLYARTKVMSNFAQTTVSTNPFNNQTQVWIQPGETIHVVTGVGGHAVDEPYPTLVTNPWWEVTMGQSHDPPVHAAALVCTFRFQGLINQTRCQEIDVTGTLLDEFRLYT
jgi:hypothetical protein